VPITIDLNYEAEKLGLSRDKALKALQSVASDVTASTKDVPLGEAKQETKKHKSTRTWEDLQRAKISVQRERALVRLEGIRVRFQERLDKI
jgi:hypothetical protein